MSSRRYQSAISISMPRRKLTTAPPSVSTAAPVQSTSSVQSTTIESYDNDTFTPPIFQINDIPEPIRNIRTLNMFLTPLIVCGVILLIILMYLTIAILKLCSKLTGSTPPVKIEAAERAVTELPKSEFARPEILTATTAAAVPTPSPHFYVAQTPNESRRLPPLDLVTIFNTRAAFEVQEEYTKEFRAMQAKGKSIIGSHRHVYGKCTRRTPHPITFDTVPAIPVLGDILLDEIAEDEEHDGPRAVSHSVSVKPTDLVYPALSYVPREQTK